MEWPGFVGPAYTVRSLNADAQRCVNLYLEGNETGTQKNAGRGILAFTPGLRKLTTVGTGPIRGLFRTSGGSLVCVSGNGAYLLSADWTATLLGTLNTFSGPVAMADNGTQLCIVDGPYGYIATASPTTWGRITDPDFVGADRVVYIDGYFVFNKPGTNQFYWSGLIDGTTYDSLDFQSAMGSPDPIVSLLCNGSQLQVFGSESVETFADTGSSSTFERYQGTFIDIGCAAAHSPQKIDGAYVWLGDAVVWKAQAIQPSRISTYALELALRSYGDLSGATSWVYSESGHSFYCLNIPGTDTTWVYDNSNGTWHERTYTTEQGVKQRHRAECHARFNSTHVVGDYANGNIYALEDATLTDDGAEITRDRVPPHLNSGNAMLFLSRFCLDIETGVGLDGVGQGTDPQIMLRLSKDNGRSWSNERWVSAGKIGEFLRRAQWLRLGCGRDILVWIRITDPVRVHILGAQVDIEKGSN